MTLTITDNHITSDVSHECATWHSEAAADGRGGWFVSWLPERFLDRNQAISAMTLTELIATGTTPDDTSWLHVENWAGEIAITGEQARRRILARI